MRVWITTLMIVASVAYGEDPEYDPDVNSAGGEFEEGESFIENATIITGRIRDINLAARSAVIGGYEYHFGPVVGTDRVVVKMSGRDFGAVELLKAGMFVEVHYIQQSDRRLAKLIRQLSTAEEF